MKTLTEVLSLIISSESSTIIKEKSLDLRGTDTSPNPRDDKDLIVTADNKQNVNKLRKIGLLASAVFLFYFWFYAGLM